MVEKHMLPENTQLAVDYESISAVNPPVKKATLFHTVSDEALTLMKITHLCTKYSGAGGALQLHSSRVPLQSGGYFSYCLCRLSKQGLPPPSA